MRPDVPQPWNVLSPHLDDAALSCSLLLAASPGSAITTVFAAGPASVRPLPPWDRAARFREGADVMAMRRAEDCRGAALLRASAVHLTYWDRQYRNNLYGYRGPEGDDLVAAIVGDLLVRLGDTQPRRWLIPLGLGHPDHRLTAEAGLRLAERVPGDWYVYEDLPYALETTAEVASRKADLDRRGFALVRADDLATSTERAIKKAVVACHASQRRPLGRRVRAAVRAPERISALMPRQPGLTA
jgi:LmbE family N-acetylglucosaminyl deacetylase